MFPPGSIIIFIIWNCSCYWNRSSQNLPFSPKLVFEPSRPIMVWFFNRPHNEHKVLHCWTSVRLSAQRHTHYSNINLDGKRNSRCCGMFVHVFHFFFKTSLFQSNPVFVLCRPFVVFFVVLLISFIYKHFVHTQPCDWNHCTPAGARDLVQTARWGNSF